MSSLAALPAPSPRAGPGAAAAHPHARTASQPRAYTIMVAGAARGKTALLRLLLDTAELAPARKQHHQQQQLSSSVASPASVGSISVSALASAADSGAPYPAPTPANIARFIQGASGRTTRVRTCAVEVCLPAERERGRGGLAASGPNNDSHETQTQAQSVLLNLVDTPGLDTRDASTLERSLADVLAFIEGRFAESIDDEQKARTGDHHVHLCLYLLDPDTIVPLPVSPPPSPILVPVSANSPAPATALPSSAVQSHPHPQLSHLTLPPPPSAARLPSPASSAPLTATANSHLLPTPSPPSSASVSAAGAVLVGNGGDNATTTAAHPPLPQASVPAPSSTAVSHTDTRLAGSMGLSSVSASGGALSPPHPLPHSHTHAQAQQQHPSSSAASGNIMTTPNSNQVANSNSNSHSTNGSTNPRNGAGIGRVGTRVNISGSDSESNSVAAGVGIGATAGPSPIVQPVSHPRPRRHTGSTRPDSLPNPPHLPALEVAAIKALSARTNVLPVLARADTVGAARLAAIKKAVRADLATAGIGFGIFDAGPGSGDDLVGRDSAQEAVDEQEETGEKSGVKMEVDAPTDPGLSGPQNSARKGKAKFAAIRVPRLPHAILTPDVYTHDEGVELDVYDLRGDTNTDDLDEDLGLVMSFESLVKRYTPPSPISSQSSTPGPSTPTAKTQRSPLATERASEREEMNEKEGGADLANLDEEQDKERSNTETDVADNEGAEKTDVTASLGSKDPSAMHVDPSLISHTRSSSSSSLHSSKSKFKDDTSQSRPENAKQKGCMKGKFVRRYRWGAIDALNPAHCDFVALRQAVFHHMQPLRTYTRDYLFEKFRVDVHHQRQHLAAASLHPSSSYPPGGVSPLSYSSSSTSAHLAASPPSATPKYPYPTSSGNAPPSYSSVPTSATASAVSPHSAALLSPDVDIAKEHGRPREREAAWERERSRERQPGPYPVSVQHLHHKSGSGSVSTSRGATSPGLVPLGGAPPGRIQPSSIREGDASEMNRERERELGRERERRAALPPLTHPGAAQQNVASLPPLSAVSAAAVPSPISGREYSRYPPDRYDREMWREMDRKRERERDRERDRDYRVRRDFERERGYEYGGYRNTSNTQPGLIPPSPAYRGVREDYGEAYLSDEEREEKGYRRERYDALREREREIDRERGSIRRPGPPSPRDRQYERERERELLSARPVSSGSANVGFGGLGLGGHMQPPSASTSTSTSGPPSASASGLLSAHPSTHASPSSAYPQTPASAYPHGLGHVGSRGDGVLVYEKPAFGPPSATLPGAVAPPAVRMHHMQHHHHGGGHVRGPVNPDLEYDRDIVRVRGREHEHEREMEKEKERGPTSGYGLRSGAAENRPMGVDYAGRPVVIEEDVHARLRTKKITVACNFCRSRKLKCDGGRPSCSQCIKRSHSCDYKAHARRRGAAGLSRTTQTQGQVAQEETRSDAEEDAVGDLDAEYEAGVSGPEEGAPASVPIGPNGVGVRHTAEHRPGSGSSGGPMTSRRSSNVDLMIAETLRSPRAAALERERERERENEGEYNAYASTPHARPQLHHARTSPNGNASFGSQLAPLPFSGVNSSSATSPSVSAPIPASATSPGGAGHRALTTNMQLLPSPGGGAAGSGMIALGGMTPAEQAVAASATGRKRGGPKLSRIASNYGPKVVACNFCRARKTKCDGQHPTCQSCARRSLPCSYVSDAPGRGRKPGQSYKGGPRSGTAEQKEKEAQMKKEELSSKSALKGGQHQLSPRSGASAGEGEGDVEGSGVDGDGDGEEINGEGSVEGENVERESASVSVRSTASKRGFMGEESPENGKKRLRMDEETRVGISASA